MLPAECSPRKFTTSELDRMILWLETGEGDLLRERALAHARGERFLADHLTTEIEILRGMIGNVHRMITARGTGARIKEEIQRERQEQRRAVQESDREAVTSER